MYWLIGIMTLKTLIRNHGFAVDRMPLQAIPSGAPGIESVFQIGQEEEAVNGCNDFI